MSDIISDNISVPKLPMYRMSTSAGKKFPLSVYIVKSMITYGHSGSIILAS